MTESRHALVDTEVRNAVKEMLADPEGYFERQRAARQKEAEEYVAAELAKTATSSRLTPREVAQIAFWSIFGILVLLSLLYIVYWLGYTYEMSKLHGIPGVKPYEVTP